MKATLTVLGSGTSMGVPTLGCDCAVCNSKDLHDRRTRPWGKTVGRVLAKQAWTSGEYSKTKLLRKVMRLARVEPPDRQAYGHLRAPLPATQS